jgi:hypothetical protein
MVNLITTSESNQIKQIKLTAPYSWKTTAGSVLGNLLEGIVKIFQLNIDQINQFYNNTFIEYAEDDDTDVDKSIRNLTKLIKPLSNLNRKTGETNAEYRNRYKKYVFQYNPTKAQILEIVKDVTGEYPERIHEPNQRTAYWGAEDLDVPDRGLLVADYYDEENADYIGYWGNTGEDDSVNYTAYIYFSVKPTQDEIDELCFLIEKVRMKGTRIYLVFPDEITQAFNYEIFESSGSTLDDSYPNDNDMIITYNDRPLRAFNFLFANNYEDNTSNNNDMTISDNSVTSLRSFQWDILANSEASGNLEDSTSNNNDGVIT